MTLYEKWADVPGFLGYLVSDHGRVLSTKGGQPIILRPALSQDGFYWRVGLSNGGRGQMSSRLVHQMVLEAFVGPCPTGMEVSHRNHDGRDNRLGNLEYATHLDNVQHMVRAGRHPLSRRSHCGHGHPFTPENTRYTKTGRRCRTCASEYTRRYRQRRSGLVTAVSSAA